ncbi:MFS-type transporter SLC18B1-like [Ptychodera flava]|uniref:MFS-type transporter SLC18B1-like n=1 Tax=Ptychodera flava TaxID=63121 RepID=UPI003969E644
METNAENQDNSGNIQNDTKVDDEQKSKGFTKRQILTLVSISIANLADLTSFSILAPFFPIEANKMGASDTVVGLVFGCFALVGFIVSPILGKFLPQIGSKFMFLSGSFVCGCCVIIFGFLNKLDPGTEFIVFCFVVRTIEAVGAAASDTAGYAIIAKTFPDHVSTTFGILEIFCGLGYMIGPPLGGYLYQVGGYTLPFIVLGSCTIAVALGNFFILPQQTEDSKPGSGSVLQLLSIPSILVTSACVLISSMALGFLNPTFAKHLQQFNLSSTMVGVMFLIISATYAVSAFFNGIITDKLNIAKLLMIIGNIGCGAAYLYIGPSPLLYTKSQLWIVIFSVTVLGISLGCSVVPAFNDLFITARWYGMPDNMGTQGVVSGVYNGLFSLGNFIGPTAGGALSEAVGFDWASTVFAILYLLVALLLAVFCLWEYQCGKGRRVAKQQASVVTSVNPDTDERSPLLSA